MRVSKGHIVRTSFLRNSPSNRISQGLGSQDRFHETRDDKGLSEKGEEIDSPVKGNSLTTKIGLGLGTLKDLRVLSLFSFLSLGTEWSQVFQDCKRSSWYQVEATGTDTLGTETMTPEDPSRVMDLTSTEIHVPTTIHTARVTTVKKVLVQYV